MIVISIIYYLIGAIGMALALKFFEQRIEWKNIPIILVTGIIWPFILIYLAYGLGEEIYYSHRFKMRKK